MGYDPPITVLGFAIQEAFIESYGREKLYATLKSLNKVDPDGFSYFQWWSGFDDKYQKYGKRKEIYVTTDVSNRLYFDAEKSLICSNQKYAVQILEKVMKELNIKEEIKLFRRNDSGDGSVYDF